jgi:large subunit ribosomal protein L30
MAKKAAAKKATRRSSSSRSVRRSAAEGTARDAGRPRPQQDAPRRTLEDTPSVRGMINAIQHLVRVVDEK